MRMNRSALLIGQSLRKIIRRWPALMPVVIAVALYVFTIIMVPTAFNMSAITSIVMLTLLLSFASAGQTIVLISGGMDFTVGAVMSASAILTTAIMNGKDGNFLPAFGAVMVMSVAVGLLNGACTVKIGLPPLIVTMAISNVITQLQYVLTQGSPLGYASPTFIKTVISKLFGVVPSLALYALLFSRWCFLSSTAPGSGGRYTWWPTTPWRPGSTASA